MTSFYHEIPAMINQQQIKAFGNHQILKLRCKITIKRKEKQHPKG